MTKERAEMMRRQGIFARHVADCEDCESTAKGSVVPARLCMSGTIMFQNYFDAIKEDAAAQVAAAGKGAVKP